MNKRKLIYLFYAATICLHSSVLADEQELLKTSDINKLMQQIFDEHVDQKQMNDHVIKSALRTYIDQFDPFRIYLLEDEVKPYYQISETDASKDVKNYAKGDFSEFQQLNEVIQKAIVRERAFRAELLSNRAQFFALMPKEKSDPNAEVQDPDLKVPFAKNVGELKARIKQNIQKFITDEIARFGEAKIEKNQAQTLAIYDHYFHNQENSYLFTDEQGHKLPGPQKENLFVLHVLKALANSLDAHTTFYNNSEAYDIKVRLEKEFQGVGIVMEQAADGSIVIKQLMEGGPAAKSGLVKPDDKIITIDGHQVSNLPLDQVMELIRGKAGTSVDLVVQRKVDENGQQAEKLFNIKLTREEITINDERAKATSERFGNGIIGIITLNSFYHGDNGVSAADDVRNAIKELQQKGNLRGLILDLRENSGGFLTQAVQLVSEFINNGVVVISKYSDGSEHYYRDMDGHRAYDGPLVILTSKATASAAEIVAQALQDYGVGIVVGDDRTYGKGTIQSQTVTDEKATTFFKVTVGKYYTVSGKTPQITGVQADILVPGKFSEERLGEKYLENALPADTISPEYKDDLKDVDASLKQWYLRYYYPTIQRKIDTWRDMLPTLKKNSEYRLDHNKNYQAFLKQIKGIKDEAPADDQSASEDTNGKKNFGVDDLQMGEAVNIVKDMVMLHAKEQPSVAGQPSNDFGQPTSDSQK